MKKIYALTLALAFTACSNTSTKKVAQDAPFKYIVNPTVQTKGMQQIKGLIEGHLKPALMTEMKKDTSGMSGMELCSASAKGIESAYNESLPKDSNVRRTALKYRNPENKPDAIDVAVMNNLKENKNFNPVVIELDNHYRVYKALPTMKPCLACHGDTTAMNSSVKEMINKKYPTDLASNFKENEFRGVIVSEIQK
ncbi:DUF3365 domain-containing protein [bacterium]|nr:DUF3365 domain-containing protein [bacterium]MBU1957963.1 DUF3365 domain-containing protein [bacterium]